MSSLGYSELETSGIIEDKYKSKSVKNKTYKKRRRPKEKMTGENVESFLNLMKDVGNDDTGNDSGLADFNPPPKPELTKQPDEIVDESVSKNEFNSLDDYVANEKYYNQYIPNQTETQRHANISGNKDKLFEKLNYVIHLLEEEKDSKTNNITEELVLYMFLGVFVIFIVDSFARVSKYTR